MSRRSRRIAVLALALVGLLVGTAPATPPRPISRAAAHRGGAALWPENSLAAFRGALALGVDVLELDVHPTADGHVMVIHDPTLDRTTTGSGEVMKHSRAEVQALRLRARDGAVSEERVPLLSEVLELAAPTAVELMPEIKIGPGGRRYAGIEEKVVGLIQARGLIPRTTVQAFQAETIIRVRELDPALRTMLVISRRQLEGRSAVQAVQWARAAGATDLGLDQRAIDGAVLEAARGASLRLSAWTVNDETDMRRLIDLGVDVIMSDRPDVLLRLLGRSGR